MQDYLGPRRERITDAWERAGLPADAVVLVPAGLEIPIAGNDLFHDFHAHPEYQYLAGLRDPGAVLVFDPGGAAPAWTLFVPQTAREQAVWMDAAEPPPAQAARAALDAGRPLAGLGPWLEARRGRPLALLGHEDLAHEPARYLVPQWDALEIEIDPDLSAALRQTVSEARRVKDPRERADLQAAVDAGIAGHRVGWRTARPGITERDLQIEIEAEFFRQGGERTAYPSIVRGGERCAVLHGAPGERRFLPGDLVLVDAGPEVHGYAADITRTYPAGAAFTPFQRDLYQLVLQAQQEAIAALRPGVEYRDLHLAASLTIAAGLADMGILRGHPATLVESDAHALFFPHGLGHLLGLCTHDCGGYLAGRAPSDRFGLHALRTDLPVEPGYVLTVEPGIYFIRALLTDPERRAHYAEAVAWERVDGLLDAGGVRIEDDVLVTEDGAQVMSAALPRDVATIEALRAEALASDPAIPTAPPSR